MGFDRPLLVRSSTRPDRKAVFCKPSIGSDIVAKRTKAMSNFVWNSGGEAMCSFFASSSVTLRGSRRQRSSPPCIFKSHPTREEVLS
jgi:hypothetical protein